MLLTGSYSRAVDDKQRISVPKPFRDRLLNPRGGSIYLTPSTDRSVALYEQEILERLAGRLAAASPAEKDVRAFQRIFYAQVRHVEMDRQGRLRLPPELIEFGNLGTEVVLVGVGDYLEIWNAPAWRDYAARQQANYDVIAENALKIS